MLQGSVSTSSAQQVKVLERGIAPGGVGLWGYLLHLRASNQLLLIVDCPSRGALDAASRHAALAYLERRPSRHAHCCRPPRGAWCLFPSVLCQSVTPQHPKAGRCGNSMLPVVGC